MSVDEMVTRNGLDWRTGGCNERLHVGLKRRRNVLRIKKFAIFQAINLKKPQFYAAGMTFLKRNHTPANANAPSTYVNARLCVYGEGERAAPASALTLVYRNRERRASALREQVAP